MRKMEVGGAGNISSRVQCVISLLVIFSFTINMCLVPDVAGHAAVYCAPSLDDVGCGECDKILTIIIMAHPQSGHESKRNELYKNGPEIVKLSFYFLI